MQLKEGIGGETDVDFTDNFTSWERNHCKVMCHSKLWELGNEKEMSKHITYRTVLYGLDLSTTERIEASGSKF